MPCKITPDKLNDAPTANASNRRGTRRFINTEYSMSDNADSLSSCCRLRNEITDNGFSYTLGAGGVSTGSKSVLTINLNRCIQDSARKGQHYLFFLEEVVDLVHKVQIAYNENLKYMLDKGMLPLFDAGYINMVCCIRTFDL